LMIIESRDPPDTAVVFWRGASPLSARDGG
jgi:hypothetical protein